MTIAVPGKRWAWMLPVVLLSCKNDLDRVAAIEVRNDGADRTTYGAVYHYSDSGAVSNRISADRVLAYSGERERTELEGNVELLFFDAAGREGSRLTADRGLMLSERGRMQVEGNVVFRNAKGEQLETEKLYWAQDSDRVWTDRPVRIRRAEDIIHGNGLDANHDFSRYTVRNITGILHMSAGEDTLQRPDTQAK